MLIFLLPAKQSRGVRIEVSCVNANWLDATIYRHLLDLIHETVVESWINLYVYSSIE